MTIALLTIQWWSDTRHWTSGHILEVLALLTAVASAVAARASSRTSRFALLAETQREFGTERAKAGRKLVRLQERAGKKRMSDRPKEFHLGPRWRSDGRLASL